MIVATEIKLSKKELDDLLHTLDKSYFYFQESLKEKVNPMMKKSKKIVGNKLRKRSGVDTGIYKKSLRVVDSSQLRMGYFCYQVVAKKPHYRLTHLLENGHKMVPNRHFYRPVARTKSYPHIIYGQDYVDENAMKKIKESIKESFGKGENK